MDETRKPKTHPGTWWLWVTAWSIQGVGVLVTDAMGLEGTILRFTVTGFIAALPLVALYWLLLRRRPD